MLQNNPWLVISESGRALAASAARAGLETYVIDRFADVDTRAIVREVCPVTSSGAGFDINELIRILKDYQRLRFAGVVIGSGLEAHSEILEHIGQYWKVYGNDTATVRRCNDPSEFFGVLDKLHIAYPETLIDRVPHTGDWLLKQVGGAGGHHIYGYTLDTEIPENYYLQQRIPGHTYSAVFLADGKHAVIVGVNKIRPVAPERDDFRYFEAVTLMNTNLRLRKCLQDFITALVSELTLKGLCGIDVIMDESGECRVLEVNPRPTATFDLHEHGQSLFALHLNACAGSLNDVLLEKDWPHRGHRVIYADAISSVPEFSWPAWATDRPMSGKTISAGQPVCMVHAEASSPENVLQLLAAREQQLKKLMGNHRLAA